MKDAVKGYYAAIAAHESSCRFARDTLDLILAEPPPWLESYPKRMISLCKLRHEVAAKQAICALIPSIPLPPNLT